MVESRFDAWFESKEAYRGKATRENHKRRSRVWKKKVVKYRSRPFYVSYSYMLGCIQKFLSEYRNICRDSTLAMSYQT